MRIQQKKSPKKALLIAGIAVLILGGGVYAYYATRPSDDKRSAETSNNDTPKTNDETDKTNDKTTPTTLGEDGKDTPKQYEGDSPNTSNSLTGVINYKSVVDGNLTLRVTIDQSLTSGTCSLKLTSAGKTVTRSASIITNPSSSTCEGFSVPVSELSSGQWAIEITVTSGNRTGTFKDRVTI
ncbi:hypothetical protein IPL44_01315 [Candidatus Saccharibacteria bacterium]|nr:MAG: hypothetical protein IPL44_01315 [Candidatus Saccharibacteria bacterium]